MTRSSSTLLLTRESRVMQRRKGLGGTVEEVGTIPGNHSREEGCRGMSYLHKQRLKRKKILFPV